MAKTLSLAEVKTRLPELVAGVEEREEEVGGNQKCLDSFLIARREASDGAKGKMCAAGTSRLRMRCVQRRFVE